MKDINLNSHSCPYEGNTTCSDETCGSDCIFHPDYMDYVESVKKAEKCEVGLAYKEGYFKGQEDMMIEMFNKIEDSYLDGYKACWLGEEPMIEDNELRELRFDNLAYSKGRRVNNDGDRGYARLLESRRRFEKFNDKPFGADFPFAIERKSTDSADYFRGICKGAKVVYEMWYAGLFEDGSYPVTYFSKENNGCMRNPCCLDDYEDDNFELFDEDVYEAGFEAGFSKGTKMAREEMCEDIYVDTEKICRLDQLHHDILELGKSLNPSDIDMLNAILKRVADLKYEVAKEAIDEYLGYK